MVYYLLVDELEKKKIVLADIAMKIDSFTKNLNENKKVLKELEMILEKQLKEINTTRSEIQNIELKIGDLGSALESLNSEKEKNQEMIMNASIIQKIIVDDDKINYKLPNGLVDLNRDSFIGLMKIITDDDNKIRNVIGIGKIFYEWSKHRSFRRSQYSKTINLLLKFLHNPHAKDVNNSGNKLVWNNSGNWNSFFVDPEINNGHYKIVVEATGDLFNGPYFGLASKEVLVELANSWIGGRASSCMMYFNGICCGGSSVLSRNPFSGKSSPKRLTFGLELDADTHTLYFFVDGVQIPHCVINVPSSVHFGVSGYAESLSVELKSFVKLPVSSIRSSLRSVVCAQYNWK